MRILILSSRSEAHSANFGQNVCSALREAGHEVVFNFREADRILFKLQHFGSSFLGQQLQRVIDKYTSVRGLPMWKLRGYYEGAGHKFFIGDERRNVYSPKKLVKNIGGNFDLVIVLFFMDFLNMRSIEAVCNSLKCPVLIFAVDYYLMSGGCINCLECTNHMNDCKYCPTFGGKESSIAYKNAMIKKRILSSYDIRIMVNTWMKRYFSKSSIIDQSKLLTHSFIIDEDYFKPHDIYECRKKLGLDKSKDIIISMRYRSVTEKGCEIAFDAISKLLNRMGNGIRNRLLLVTFGAKMPKPMDFDTLDFGFVPTDTLLDIYCASSMFLSPSIADAGPSTVNQAICCGTPVVAFEIGTAIDVIENGISGYRAKYKDVDDYSRGIEQIASLNEEEYTRLRESTREMGVKMNSKKSFAQFIEENFSNQTK